MGSVLVIKGADFSKNYVEKVDPIVNKVKISVLADPESGGTCIGSGLYNEGETVTISAVPNDMATFLQWSDGNTSPTRTITVGGVSKTYIAKFKVREAVADIEVVQEKSGVNQSTGFVFGQALIWTENARLKTSRFTIDSSKTYRITIDSVNSLSGFALVWLTDTNDKAVAMLAKCEGGYVQQVHTIDFNPADYPTAKYLYFHSHDNWTAMQE